MTLSVDTSRALRTQSDRRRLAEAIRDAPSREPETDWVEWKVGVSLKQKEWQAEIARQILGFANRHPDRAASTCGGCAYLVLGVEPGNVAGVDLVDPAELDDTVSAYVGKDGPQWDPDHVEVDGKTVLVITVEPPRWGDRIFAFEKEFDWIKNGDVFVRRSGKTQRASAQEIRMLSERAAAQGERLMVDLEWWDEPGSAVGIDVSDAAQEAWVASERRALLGDSSLKGLMGSRLGAELIVETRDWPSYESNVERYLADARPRLRDLWMRDAVEEGLGKIEFAVVNLTENNFADVQVVMEFEGDAWSAFDPLVNMVGFPPRPRPWGSHGASPIKDLLAPLQRITVPMSPPEPRGWSDNKGSTTLSFAPVDVRPGYRHLIGPVHLIASAEYMGQELEGAWHATCKSTSGVARGVFAVRVAEADR